MLFSVLIPLYNAEKYFSECLDSVLAQNFYDFEIVIADDGSTDNSGTIADEYQKKHPKCIRVIHKENSGVLLTRRRLMKESRGEYIIWVDADDVIKPNLMESLHREIISKSPDVIIYNYEMFDKPEKIVRSLPLSHETMIVGNDKHAVYTKMLLGKDMNELWTKCIKRSVIDIDADYSRFKHVSNGDDVFCLMPILDNAKRIEYLDVPYYRYRIVSNSITHAKSYQCYYSYRTVYERIADYIAKWEFSEQERAEVKNRFANRFVDCTVSCANDSKTNYQTFLSFVKDILEDEKRVAVFSDSERKLPSKVYQRYYKLLINKKYYELYRSVKIITAISRMKSRKQR